MSYTMRATMHADLTKGGTLWGYEVLRDGIVVGSASVLRETRRSPEVWKYVFKEVEYDTVAAFIAACEAKDDPK